MIGGLALVYIGWKLTHGRRRAGTQVAARDSVRGAIQTIVIADAVMGVDNVLAVGGAAHGNMWLVMIGLAVSVPIVIWGSTLVLKWVERFPQIMWLGAAVLGWTAAKMIASEPLLRAVARAGAVGTSALPASIVGGLIAMPIWRALTPDARAQSIVIAMLIAWLALSDYVERAMGTVFDRSTTGNGTTRSSTSCAGSGGFRWRCWCTGAVCARRRPRAGEPLSAVANTVSRNSLDAETAVSQRR